MAGMNGTVRTYEVWASRDGRRHFARHPFSGYWYARDVWNDPAFGETKGQWAELSMGLDTGAMARLTTKGYARHGKQYRSAYLPRTDPRKPCADRPYFSPVPVAWRGLDPDQQVHRQPPNCRCAPIHQKEDQDMSTASAAVAREEASRLRVPPGTKTVGVRFPGNAQVYHYLSDLPLEVGDDVVVKSPSTGPTVVKVATVDQSVTGVQHAYKWVVQALSKSAASAYEDRERRAAELKALDAKIERQSKIAQGRVNERLLAQYDPALAELLAQRDSIENPQPASHTIYVDAGGVAGYAVRDFLRRR